MNRQLRLERAIDDILLEELDGVEGDDTVRVACMLDELIAHVEEHPRAAYDGFPAADALWLLRDLRRGEPTAGELRTMLARFRGQVAGGTR